MRKFSCFYARDHTYIITLNIWIIISVPCMHKKNERNEKKRKKKNELKIEINMYTNYEIAHDHFTKLLEDQQELRYVRLK